jgi:hypothetical protein
VLSPPSTPAYSSFGRAAPELMGTSILSMNIGVTSGKLRESAYRLIAFTRLTLKTVPAEHTAGPGGAHQEVSVVEDVRRVGVEVDLDAQLGPQVDDQRDNGWCTDTTVALDHPRAEGPRAWLGDFGTHN